MQQELRPLNLGEILDRTFQMYRSHFLMFAGISSLAAAIDLVWKLAQSGVVRQLALHHNAMLLGLTNAGLSLISLLVYVVASALALAAIARAVSALYLGRPTGIAAAYREIKGRWLRYVWVYTVAYLLAWGLALLAIAGVVGVLVAMRRQGAGATPAMLLGILGLSMLVLVPFGIWMMLRYALANAVCVFEDTGVRDSLKRSVQLSQGSRGRIFVMFLLVGVLVTVLSYAAVTPLIVVLIKHRGQAVPFWETMLTLLAGFVVTSITTPIYGIALPLFYYDARIRKEGFDVDWMMQKAMAGVETGAAVYAGQSGFSGGLPFADEPLFTTPLEGLGQSAPPMPPPGAESPLLTPSAGLSTSGETTNASQPQTDPF